MTAPLLVVAHEAQRKGATKVLLDVLPHLASGVGRPLAISLRADGSLAAELRSFHTAAADGSAPAAVLVNSALAADVLTELPAAVPSVVWVHEVVEGLAHLVPAARRGLVEVADRVLCVSERSRTDLVALGVPGGRIEVVPPVVDLVEPSPEEIAAARAELVGADAPDDVRLVIGCGEATWRKGTDLFVALARELVEDPRVRLAWVGRRNRAFSRQLDHDVVLAGVEGALRWHGEVERPGPALAAADLLVLTSREDPQPLVPLEAALAGTPTVGFAGTGLDDVAVIGGAEVVPFPDTSALAERAAAILADPARGATLVAEARALVARERSCATVAPQVVAAVRAVLELGAPTPARPSTPSEPT